MQADYDDDLKLQILINLCEQLFDMTIFLYATGPLTEVPNVKLMPMASVDHTRFL